MAVSEKKPWYKPDIWKKPTTEALQLVRDFIGKNADQIEIIGEVLGRVGGFVPIFGGPINAAGDLLKWISTRERQQDKEAEKLRDDLKLLLEDVVSLNDMFSRLSENPDIDFAKSVTFQEVKIVFKMIDTFAQATTKTKKVENCGQMTKLVSASRERLHRYVQQETLEKVIEIHDIAKKMDSKMDTMAADIKELNSNLLKQKDEEKAQTEKKIKEKEQELKDTEKAKFEKMYSRETIATITKSLENSDPLTIYQEAKVNESQKYYALSQSLYEMSLEKVKKIEETGKEYQPSSTKICQKLANVWQLKTDYYESTVGMSAGYKNPWEEYLKK